MPTNDEKSDKDKCLELFLKISLDERTARNTIANNKVTTNLTAVINEVINLVAWTPNLDNDGRNFIGSKLLFAFSTGKV